MAYRVWLIAHECVKQHIHSAYYERRVNQWRNARNSKVYEEKVKYEENNRVHEDYAQTERDKDNGAEQKLQQRLGDKVQNRERESNRHGRFQISLKRYAINEPRGEQETDEVCHYHENNFKSEFHVRFIIPQATPLT
jgi:hypothetical protein